MSLDNRKRAVNLSERRFRMLVSRRTLSLLQQLDCDPIDREDRDRWELIHLGIGSDPSNKNPVPIFVCPYTGYYKIGKLPKIDKPKFWVCDLGTVHQVVLRVVYEDPDYPSRFGVMLERSHLSGVVAKPGEGKINPALDSIEYHWDDTRLKKQGFILIET